MLKLSIPTPCHEDWNKMTPDETGRHCSVCVKSVVDFTNMSDEEVKYFFLNKKEDERVCGRFKQTQLHRITIELPQNILSMQMPLWKKFLAACLIVFSTTLFSCDTKILNNGYEETITTGMIMVPRDTSTIPVPPPPTRSPDVNGMVFTAPGVLQGDIVIDEAEPVKQPVEVVVAAPLKDTMYTCYDEDPLKQGPPGFLIKTKNPPAADSVNCKTIKNFN